MENEKLNEILAGLWDSLTDEQKEKAKACKNLDELMKLAGEEKIELPDEMLDAVSGGVWAPTSTYNPADEILERCGY